MNNSQDEVKELIYTQIKKEWLNPHEVSREYNFSTSTLSKWRMKNLHLKFSKVGKYIRYKRSDIEALLNSHLEPIAEVA